MMKNKPALFFAILSLVFALLYLSTFKMPFRPDIKLHGLLEVSKFDENDENKQLFYDMANNNGLSSWFIIESNKNDFTNLSNNLEEVRKIFKDNNSTILIGFFSLNQKMW